MQKASRAYKTEMREHLRNESYVWVYLGVIDVNAQRTAYSISDFTEFASPGLMNDPPVFEAYYATFEENQTRCDQSQFFLPEDEAYALYQGGVTRDIKGEITFLFRGYSDLNLRGLTIDFGDFYPTEFTISNGETTRTYTNDKPGEWVTTDAFNHTSYITITPISMVGGNQRFRIMRIQFGVGLTFSNTELISTSRKTRIDPISSSLPTRGFTFVVDNISEKFAQDDPGSYSGYLQQKQEVYFEYGRKLSDGSIERIPGGRTMLKSWSSDDTKAKFTSVGILDYMQDTYYKGKYYPNGINLYDLALDVLQDAAVENFTVDEYLKDVVVYNPLPIDTHKNCLQMIANASRSVLYEDRVGGIAVRTSFVADITGVTGKDPTPFSDVASLVTEDAQENYASLELDYTKSDGTQYFLPPSDFYKVGYVSEQIARERDNRRLPFLLGVNDVFSDKTVGFDDNPMVTIDFEAAFTCFGLSLIFGDAIPIQLIVRGLHNGQVVAEETFDELTKEIYLPTELVDVDQIQIEFIEALSGQRIHLQKIKFGSVTDYHITYEDLLATPIATDIDRVSKVNVHMYQYSESTETEEKQLATADVVAGDNIIQFTDSSYGFSAKYTDDNTDIPILESGAHYVLINAPRDGKVEIRGYAYTIADNVYQLGLNETGIEKTVKNHLISNIGLATKEAEWVGEHFDNDTDYALTYRGEPRLDCGDLVYLENKYVDENMIRITEEQLDTSVGMSMNCKLRARRVSYKERV